MDLCDQVSRQTAADVVVWHACMVCMTNICSLVRPFERVMGVLQAQVTGYVRA